MMDGLNQGGLLMMNGSHPRQALHDGQPTLKV